jgi:hypothetical protein
LGSARNDRNQLVRAAWFSPPTPRGSVRGRIPEYCRKISTAARPQALAIAPFNLDIRNAFAYDAVGIAGGAQTAQGCGRHSQLHGRY